MTKQWKTAELIQVASMAVADAHLMGRNPRQGFDLAGVRYEVIRAAISTNGAKERIIDAMSAAIDRFMPPPGIVMPWGTVVKP